MSTLRQEVAELKIKNDTSTTYTIKVTIDGETNYEGKISPGGIRNNSKTSGFSFI